MPLNCGIVGLPNVGKSTIFSALTSAPAEAANYPFCTIDPNVGIVNVPDDRLDKIVALIPTEKVIPAAVEFVDIAGLVKGASKGEGLGNRFLSHIREVGVIIHVVRCFENADIVHVDNTIDPTSDIETINVELALADLETVEKKIAKSVKDARSADKELQKKTKTLEPLLNQLKEVLSEGQAARSIDFDEEALEALRELHLITLKPMLYVCNVDEDGISEDNQYVKAVQTIASKEDAAVIKLSGQLESEISQLEDPEERAAFLEEAGLEESGLHQLIVAGYKLLGLRTFFTAGPKEVRAWTFKDGFRAPQAAGVIHTDFEKGFIKAETYHVTDLFELETEAKIKEKGKLRQEGKEYLVKDGDVMHFKFNT
jgi:GTP-binding protein YchF